MFLKSLTLRGFKSFADRTVLEFEPGITAMVGPNGSGKSNVVDALAWVLGTRSAKVLRGGELADVIFAGSPGRPAVGQAKVEIVIDNSRGQLGGGGVGLGGSAQGFSEVRLSREILASGENVYAINGVECRLLDVQELLSDTGLGRELHTIVGQGQLDAILHAKPEERRAFVEEAAGILKHRRRRERAHRKLEHVDVHVEKLRTVLRELRRQLRPLERQADAANKHAQLQAERREACIRLAAHDLAGLRRAWQHADEHDASSATEQARLEAATGELEAAVEAAEERLRGDLPRADATRAGAERLARLRERLQGTADVIEARRRHLLESVEDPLVGRPPKELRTQADRIDAEHAARLEALAAAQAELEQAAVASRDAQLARREHERERAASARARAEARERHLRWQGDVRAHRNAVDAASAEAARLETQLAELDARGRQLRVEIEAVQDEIRRLDAEEWHLTETVEHAESALADAEAALHAAVSHEHDLERERASQAARADALRAASAHTGDGATALLSSQLDGVLGLLADHVRVEAGAEAAVAAALGPLDDAVVARSAGHAAGAVAHLRRAHRGRAVVLPSRAADEAAAVAPAPPAATRPVAGLLAARDRDSVGVLAALRHALAGTFVAADWPQAVALHEEHPDLTFVTPDGDVAGPCGFVGGAAPDRSSMLSAAAAEDAERRVAELDDAVAAAVAQAARARTCVDERRTELAAATAALNGSDARITAAAEQLDRLAKDLDALTHQEGLLRQHRAQLTASVERHQQALVALETEDLVAPPSSDDPDPADRDGEVDRLDRRVEECRTRELHARLAVERLDEQVRHLRRAAAGIREEADQVEQAIAEAARRRDLRRQHVRRCSELAAVAAEALTSIDSSIRAARADRDRLDADRARREQELAALRRTLRERVTELDAARERRHAADLQRAELRHRLDQLTTRVRDELQLAADDLLAEHPDAATYDRADLVAQLETLDRKVASLGRINPLALEEFHALEERHRFLSRQLDDLGASRRDLHEVIQAVDAKIRNVFADAFRDVAREFEEVFATIFPGGHGRLTLTDPDDLLSTGIEVAARPPGKRIRRLSLLSGGERSLTALAFLFAIFRARPSPFYVLDEVEASLDEVNLRRFLQVMESFKETSQVLVVTHQTPTMEIADLLYGVTMGADAVSKVVAERLSEDVPA